MNAEQVDQANESYDWSALAGELGWDEVRRRLNKIATARGEWAGIPVPVAGCKVVCANERQRFAELWPSLPGESVNSWHVQRAFRVFMFEHDGKRTGTVINYWAERLDALFDTIRARRAVLPDAEMTAFVALLGHLNDTQARDYVVSNMFMERGRRSGLLYLFRRGLPILTFRTSEETVEPRAALCLHPLAYYENTHAGVLPPSDEALALLLMLRADEPYLWRKANQMTIRHPLVAV